jgi:hypothetical protein
VTTQLYRLARDLPAAADGNWFPRDLKAGETLHLCTAPYIADCATRGGVMLTEDPEGGYPGYEVPRAAVQRA